MGAWACVAVVTTDSPHLIYAYIVLSPLGVRTEEARALRWDHVDLHANARVPPHVAVWRSVRVHGETAVRLLSAGWLPWECRLLAHPSTWRPRAARYW
jgi:hypothetical protein